MLAGTADRRARTRSRLRFRVGVLCLLTVLALGAALLVAPEPDDTAVLEPELSAAQAIRTLSVTASHPRGADVSTTFSAARVDLAGDGWQGASRTLPASPADRSRTSRIAGPLAFDGSTVRSRSSAHHPYQRFDLPWRGTGQRLVWSGTVDPARTIVLSAWTGSGWKTLARSRGASGGPVTLEVGVSESLARAGVVNVLVHAEDPFDADLPHRIGPRFEKPEDYDFAIAHQSDPQHLARAAVVKKNPRERAVWKRGITDSARWLAANARKRKIALAVNTGDLADSWLRESDAATRAIADGEFAVVSAAQRTIENAGIVTTTLPGNHDNLSGRDTGPGALYNRWFGPARYRALADTPAWRQARAKFTPWRPGDASNNVTTLSAGGLDFVVVSLGFRVTPEELDWASGVFASHPDRNGILLTHSYSSPSSRLDGRGTRLSTAGARIRDKVVAKNPNVALVLSGHESGVSVGVRRSAGASGHHVVEMLSDYQGYRFTGDQLGLSALPGYSSTSKHRFGASFLRLLQVDVDRSEISVDAYSPFRKAFGAGDHDLRRRYDGREDDFRIPVKFTSRTTSFGTDALFSVGPEGQEIGRSTTTSGTSAAVDWGGLSAGTTYAWTSASRDARTGAALPGATRTGWFVARGSTDTTAPQLVLPPDSTLAHGATFNPRRGVSARDDDGTVLTSQVQVRGRVDTSRTGTYTLVHSVRDAAGNTTTRRRSVAVAKAPSPVLVKAPVLKGSGRVGSTVSTTPGTWRKLGSAQVNVQWLRDRRAIPGATGTRYRVRPDDVGKRLQARIKVRASGRSSIARSTKAVKARKRTTRMSVVLPRRIRADERPVVRARLASGSSRLGGTVVVLVDGKKVGAVAVEPRRRAGGVARVRLPALPVGSHRVEVAYRGTGTFAKVTRTRTLTVAAR